MPSTWSFGKRLPYGVRDHIVAAFEGKWGNAPTPTAVIMQMDIENWETDGFFKGRSTYHAYVQAKRRDENSEEHFKAKETARKYKWHKPPYCIFMPPFCRTSHGDFFEHCSQEEYYRNQWPATCLIVEGVPLDGGLLQIRLCGGRCFIDQFPWMVRPTANYYKELGK